MLEVAEIFRLHGESFRASHRLAPWQWKAMVEIEHCRTAYFGGHLEQCDRCGHEHYSYHSCRNRHCPKCHGEQTQAWLQKQQGRLLPVAYYLLTFTWPAPLRALAKNHPRQIYNLLMKAAVASLQSLAHDPQWVGGTLPILAVLHTWTRTLLLHPHVHILVPAGGISPAGAWVHAKHPQFLLPGYALSQIFRAKIKAGLQHLHLWDVNCPCWKQKWDVHCRHAGSGDKVLDYLARYVFRIGISNSRLEKLQDEQVTFRYRNNKTQELCHTTIPAQEFIQRFLQHVLPKGFVKVRAYGLWSSSQKERLAKIQQELAQTRDSHPLPTHQASKTGSRPTEQPRLCPQCKLGSMRLIRTIPRQRGRPP